MITLYLHDEPSKFGLGRVYLVLFERTPLCRMTVNTNVRTFLDCLAEDEDLLYQAQKALSGEMKVPGFCVSYDIFCKIMQADTGIPPEESEKALRVEQELQRQEKRESKSSALKKVSQALRMLSEAVDELRDEADENDE